ncbi:hemolysin family protein [Streptomyces fradiae]|uniref:hemolysin family protein n=1 Tax=Streptomyces fradiae TaxID=1906 RepID=UPI0033D042F3
MSFPMALFVTVVLLAASGFFVAAEFALVAARRHRVEKAAAEGRRGAKAALAGMRELSLMLAGAQLGITVCTLGLGSISKPAISHQVDPLLVKLGLPAGLSYGIAFAFAMALVVFLHMVVGEMAPKSWAIAHPERSAMLLSPPFRATVTVVRPLLLVLNRVSNALVRLCRVQPRDELTAVHNREQLTHLVAESERLGLINATDSELITRSLTEPQTPVADLMVPAARIVTVPAGAGVDTILATATAAGRARLLVTEERGTGAPARDALATGALPSDGRAPDGRAGSGQAVLGSVHARDALVARARGRAATARQLARPVPELKGADSLAHAVEQLRRHRASLAVVRDADGRLTGLVSLDDLLARLLGSRAA